MKTFLFLTLINHVLFPGNPKKEEDIVKMRDLYYAASVSETKFSQFENFVDNSPDIAPEVLQGYKAMRYFLKAKFAWNPVNKLTYFSKGRGFLDNAIVKSKTNVELRFLRFTVQTNAPSFLQYSSDISDDKTIILKNYKEILDNDLKLRVRNYMIKSSFCNNTEKGVLND